MRNYPEISMLKYELKNPHIREWALKFGVVDLTRKMVHLEKSGDGWLGHKRYNQIIKETPLSDFSILRRVNEWLNE